MCSFPSSPARSAPRLVVLIVLLLSGCAALRGESGPRAATPPDSAAAPQADPAARPAETLAQRADLAATRTRDCLAAGCRQFRDGVEAVADSPVVTCVLFPVGVAAKVLGHMPGGS
jgi:hypothetical protein